MSARSCGPAGLQLRPAPSFLDVRTPWEPLLPSLAYPKLGFTISQLGLDNRLPYVYVFYILTIPYILSLADYCYIRRTSPLGPLKA